MHTKWIESQKRSRDTPLRGFKDLYEDLALRVFSCVSPIVVQLNPLMKNDVFEDDSARMSRMKNGT